MQRLSRNRHRSAASLVLLAALLCSALALAADLSELKAQGVIGERADGYLGLVQSEAPLTARNLVEEINAKRKAEYQRIATRNSIALSEVEALAGKKTLGKTASGGWIYVEAWRQKSP
ncbi:MAG: YdbL family protein [Pseudomonadales bacterium]